MTVHEQRIADPTLDRQHEGRTRALDHAVAIGDLYARVPVAHRLHLAGDPGQMHLAPACGAHRGPHAADWHLIPVEHARWIARPCRRCYPGSPAPIELTDTRLYWQSNGSARHVGHLS